MIALTSEELNKFTSLYEKYEKTIYYTIKNFNIDEYTIEDLTQEIYIIIVKKLDDIDLNNHKKTQNYIITITRNYCINYKRSLAKREEILNKEISDFSIESMDLLQQIINKEQIHLMFEEIKKLDDIYKSVLELKYLEGFSNKEIAYILKIKKKTVEMRLYCAKIILKKCLKRYCVEERTVHRRC